MKLLQVHTFYPKYIDYIYGKNPGLGSANYEDQVNFLLNDAFAAAHMIAPHMKKAGYDGSLIIANALPAQKAWLKENGYYSDDGQNIYQTVYRQIEKIRPDILYLSDPVLFDAKFVNSLSYKPSLVAGWRAASILPDTRWDNFDLLLSNHKETMAEAKNRGVKKIRLFHPGMPGFVGEQVKNAEKKYDIVFSGQVSYEHIKRYKLLSALLHVNQKLGSPWKIGYFIPDENSVMSDEFRKHIMEPLWGMDMYRALASGKIALNIHIDIVSDQAANMRLFESTMSGSLLFTENFSNLKNYFIPGTEAVAYDGPEDMIEKINYYLNNDEEREKIAAAGYDRCVREHSMEQRVLMLDSIIKETLKEKESPSAKPLAEKKYTAEGNIKEIKDQLSSKINFLPRRTPGAVKYKGRELKYADVHSFYNQLYQIFVKNIYGINAEPKPELIIDAGAHTGLASFFYGITFPEAEVFAYEADPQIFSILESNIKEFGLTNVKVFNKAVWTHNDGVKFDITSDDSGHITSEANGSLVPSVSLKELLKNRKNIVLKMDVEGAEFDLIKDCAGHLENVTRMIIEVHNFGRGSENLGELLNIIQTAGFSYTLDDFHAADWIKENNAPPFPALRTGNFIVTVYAWKNMLTGKKKNTDGLNILQLMDNQKTGGAAIAGNRLFTGLSALDTTNTNLISVTDRIEDQPNAQGLNEFIQTLGDPSGLNWKIIIDRLFEEINPDVINIHNIHEALHYRNVPLEILEFFAEKAPLVFTLHDMWLLTGRCAYADDCTRFIDLTCDSECPTYTEYPALEPAKISAALNWKINFFNKYPETTFVTPSRWLANETNKSFLKNHRIEVIPNSVDTAVFKPYAEREQLRSNMGFAKEDIVFLVSAADLNDPRKGMKYFYEAVSEIDVKLNVIVSGNSENLPSLARNVKIYKTGFIKNPREMAAVYSAADVFVITALNDNLPNVLLESLACGTPALGFNRGGIPEVIVPGKTGWICGEVSSAALKNSIIAILNETSWKPAMPGICRETALKEYSPAVQAERYFSLFKAISAKVQEKKSQQITV